jgi:hypothetical protein
LLVALVTSIIAGPMMNGLLSHRIDQTRRAGNPVEVAAD